MAKFRVNAEIVSVFNTKENKSVYLRKNETYDSADFDVNHLHALASNGKSNKVKNEKTGKLEDVVVYQPSITWQGTAPEVEDQRPKKAEKESSKMKK